MAGKIKVRYKGIADVRTIGKTDLEVAGVEGVQEDLVWHRGNLFSLELDANDKLEEVLRNEGHFTISKVTDDGGAAQLSGATDPNAEGDVLVDGDTGASTPTRKSTRS